MKKIQAFVTSDKNISSSLTVRSYKVIGEDGAIFSLRLRRADGGLYNFKTGAFDAVSASGVMQDNSEHRLANVSASKRGYTGSVKLPAQPNGDEYAFMLYAEPHFNTIMSPNFKRVATTGSGDTLVERDVYSPYFWTKRTIQEADSVITFTLASKAHASKYQSFGTDAANVVVSRSPSDKGITQAEVIFTVKAALADDSNGFKLVRDAVEQDFEISSTTSVGGTSYIVASAVTASKDLRLSTVNSLSTGDFISNNHSGSTLPVIESIDYSTNTITLSVVQTLAEGVVLTFTGGGSSSIKRYSGVGSIDFSGIITEIPTSIIVLNGDHVGTGAIGVDDTKGLVLGMTLKGPGFDNRNVDEVITAIDIDAKTIRVTSTQSLKDNASLTVSGGGNEATIKAKVAIESFPKNNTTITLDLDNILLPAGIS